MANHSLPTISSTYSNFVTELDARFDDLAVGLDPLYVSGGTLTGQPTNTIRWTSAGSKWEKWSGSAWADLSAAYSININGTVGATTPTTGAFTTLSTSGVATLAANSTVGGSAIVTLAATQTLTNKTLTSPIISTISNTGTITLPTSTDTLVGRATTDTLTNKTLTAPRFVNTGFIADSNGASLLTFGVTASAVNQVTLTNAATTGTPSLAATGTDTNINLNLVSKGTGVVQANGVAVATISGTQTLTNKTLTSPIISSISNTGTITLPTSTDTLVGRATTDTLTNKTLTAPKFADTGFIADPAGIAYLVFNQVASATNQITITQAATTGKPSIGASGTDANITLNLLSKGTGTVQANGVDVVTISGTQTLTNKTWNSATIAIAYGGTGATTAADARTNLDVPTRTGGNASGSWGINITGNAATATAAVNLSTTRTNWATNGTITAVVGQLAWKNFADGHTIFDASAATAPDGTSISNTNATVAWSATYPTLMGWNGTSTYGVRVDSARVSDNTTGNAATVTNGVYTTGDQTIGGTKTFSSTISGSINGNAATVTNGVYTTGSYADPAWITSINYNKLTGTVPTWNQNTTGNAATVTNGVYTTGDQTIGGNKTFSGTTTTAGLTVGSGTSSSITMNDSDEGARTIHNNSNQIGFLTQAGGWGAWCDDSGNWTATANVTAYSDERLKKDWSNLPDNFIEQLAGVKHGTYTRVDTGKRQIGVSAQSLQPVAPEGVLEGELLSVAYGNVALAAVVELSKEILKLRQEIAQLKGSI